MKFHEKTLKHSAVETSGRDSRRNEAVRLIEQQDKFRGTSLVDRTCFVLGFQSAILFFPFIQFLVGLDKVIDQAVHVEIESISRERRRTKLVLRWLSFPWSCPSSVEYRGTRSRLFVVEAPLPRSRIDRSTIRRACHLSTCTSFARDIRSMVDTRAPGVPRPLLSFVEARHSRPWDLKMDPLGDSRFTNTTGASLRP